MSQNLPLAVSIVGGDAFATVTFPDQVVIKLSRNTRTLDEQLTGVPASWCVAVFDQGGVPAQEMHVGTELVPDLVRQTPAHRLVLPASQALQALSMLLQPIVAVNLQTLEAEQLATESLKEEIAIRLLRRVGLRELTLG